MSATKSRKRTADAGVRTSPDVERVPLDDIYPADQNDDIYGAIDPDHPDVQKLADSIREKGILEPLTVTLDGVTLSGHRRYAASRRAGLTHVPVKRHPIRSTDPGFVPLLTEFNMQRVKTAAQMIREEIVRTRACLTRAG